MKRPVVAVLLLAILACRTVGIVPRSPIEVPAGLDLEHVELSVLAALSGHAPAALMRQMNKPGGGGMEAVRLAALSNRTVTGDGWFPEFIEPGEMWVSYHRGRHRLKVSIVYTTFEVRTEITGSEFLRQDGRRIHRAAIGWIKDLESRIKESLKTVAVLVPRQRHEGR